MKGSEFLRKIRRYCKRNGLDYTWAPDQGKGSHGALTVDRRFTVVRNLKDELKTGTLHAMLKQLGIEFKDI